MLEELKNQIFSKTKSGKVSNNEKKYKNIVKKIMGRGDNILEFIIYSDDIKGAARPRHRSFKRGKVIITTTYDPKSNKDFKRLIKTELRKNLPDNHVLYEESLKLDIEVYKKMPSNFSMVKKVLAEEKFIVPCKKPDLDNYAKLPMDAMNQLIYEDDVYVTKLSINKYYSLNPRLVIRISMDLGTNCG